MGICALCRETATLRKSHYLPAAFFRRLHSNGRPPVVVDARSKREKCPQPKVPLLCDKCEHRFKTQGEDWVIDCTCKATGGFALRDLLLRNRTMSPDVATAFWYNGQALAKMRHREIVYFAASVFWRGCAYDWSRVDSSLSRLEFAPELELEFREFLLGKSAFPPSVILQVDVAFDPFLVGGRLGITFPEAVIPRKPIARQGPPVGYFFFVCGLTFTLYFDFGIPAGLSGKSTSIAEAPHPLLLTNVRMSEVRAGQEALELTAVPKGRLSRSSGRT